MFYSIFCLVWLFSFAKLIKNVLKRKTFRVIFCLAQCFFVFLWDNSANINLNK